MGAEVLATHRSGVISKGVILRSTRENKGTYPFLLNNISYTAGGKCWNTREDLADIVNVTFKLTPMDEGNKHVTVKAEISYVLSLSGEQAEQLARLIERAGSLRGTPLGSVQMELRGLFQNL